MEYDVFIGYSRKDSKAAEKIEDFLSKAGFKCWRDKTLVPGSDEWVEAITKAIDASHIYIAVVSEHSVVSKYVARELMVADTAGKIFLPIILSDKVKLSPRMRFLFSELQHIYGVPTLEMVLPELANAVSKAVDRVKHKGAYNDETAIFEHANYHYVPRLEENMGGLYVGQSDAGMTTVEGSTYFMAGKPDMYLGHHIHTLPKMGEFILEASLRKLDGPDDQWFGFEFGDYYPGDYYQFLLSGQGGVRIAKHWNREWRDMAYRESLRQAKTGNSQNTLKVVRKGASFHIFVNNLYVTTINDFDIRLGKIGLVVGWALRVAFADLRIEGITLDILFQEAIDHWNKLEILEARQLLKHLVDLDPSNQQAARLLLEFRPDYRESILIVIGYQILPQINEGFLVARLKEEINIRGRPHELRFACIVTDTGLLEEEIYMRCPLISVGGPKVNKITARFADELPPDPSSTEHIHIHQNMEKGSTRVALWGSGSLETAKAVESFIYSGLLDGFLDMIWGRERPNAVCGSSPWGAAA